MHSKPVTKIEWLKFVRLWTPRDITFFFVLQFGYLVSEEVADIGEISRGYLYHYDTLLDFLDYFRLPMWIKTKITQNCIEQCYPIVKSFTWGAHSIWRILLLYTIESFATWKGRCDADFIVLILLLLYASYIKTIILDSTAVRIDHNMFLRLLLFSIFSADMMLWISDINLHLEKAMIILYIMIYALILGYEKGLFTQQPCYHAHTI